MDFDRFMAEIDAWLADVRSSCASLHERGVPSERTLGIATATADALAIKRAMKRAELIPGGPRPMLRG